MGRSALRRKGIAFALKRRCLYAEIATPFQRNAEGLQIHKQRHCMKSFMFLTKKRLLFAFFM